MDIQHYFYDSSIAELLFISGRFSLSLVISAFFTSQNILLSQKWRNLFALHVDREFRDDPRKRARATMNAFFRRRELLAFFVSMAGARLQDNEFFSQRGTRERTEINLNLARTVICSRTASAITSSHSFSLWKPWTLFCHRVTAEERQQFLNQPRTRPLYRRNISNKVRERSRLSRPFSVSSLPLFSPPMTFYLFYRFASLQHGEPSAGQIQFRGRSGTIALG